MDERTFGELSKRMGAAPTRRSALLALAGGVAAGLAGGLRGATAQDVGEEAFGFCRAAGRPCGRDKQCCAGRCRKKKGICGCLKKGKSCINRAGIACCSQSCRDGKCQ